MIPNHALYQAELQTDDTKWVQGRHSMHLWALHLPPYEDGETFIFSTLRNWMQKPDLNRRPFGYEPNALPDCAILL